MTVFAALGLFAGTGWAAADTAPPALFICSGTSQSPGVLSGTFTNVIVQGTCNVNAGTALVRGNVIVGPGGVLVAAFALNDQAGTGTSSLTVQGNVMVQSGATLFLGCEAAHSPCNDDPNQQNPTLSTPGAIGGSLLAVQPLGVLVHNSTIGLNAIQTGGGGGVNCQPSGVFAQMQSPVFSDYEDNTIGGSLNVTGLGSCWFGALRNHVAGSVVVVGNTMADSDANEVLTNQIGGSLICVGNSPAIQFGDSAGSTPNLVSGAAAGECGFDVLAPSPAPSPGPPPEPAGPLKHISVHA